ncbi:MAG: phosphoribosylanthranilate isomerase [Proteobacteria bacterium]|nr:phosphoribosylanthranilate isomerase [Pseudomonadota bacterium]
MKVQIYTLQSVEEALEVSSIGVQHIGITPSNIGLPGEISYEVAKSICNEVTEVTKVALSVSSDLDEIVDMVMYVNPDILHLCGEPGEVNVKDIILLRDKLQNYERNIPIMQAISVEDNSAIEFAKEYENVCEYFILDTSTTLVQGVGASGKVHDWKISKSIVDTVKVPVILAGGLSPDNVQEAIAKVNPWGVDSLTHTNRILEDGNFVKDIEKVKKFFVNATK